MSLLHESEIDIDEPHRFRAATIDAALADARAALGGDVRIVEANRIRRGGVGGFFATDLGVELVVATGGDDADAEVHLNAPEYIDLSVAGPALPRAPRTGDGLESTPRPHFYDRVIEESAPAEAASSPATMSTLDATSPGIQRLLDAADGAERGRRSPAAATASFADHLARHLEDGGAVNPTVVPRRPATDLDLASVQLDRGGPRAEHRSTEQAPVADSLDGAVADSPVEAPRPAAAEPTVAVADGPEPAEPAVCSSADDAVADRPAPTEPVPAATVEPDGPAAEPAPVDAPATKASASKPRKRSSASRDPLRRPVDLAAGAVGRIVEQLSDVTPVEGSRMRDLTRLVVRVTTPDGSTIEIAAELNGADHG